MLVIELISDGDKRFVPSFVSCLIASNKQNRTAARVKSVKHPVGLSGMLYYQFLHVRVPRRGNRPGMWTPKFWTDFLQKPHLRVSIFLLVLSQAVPPHLEFVSEFNVQFHGWNMTFEEYPVKQYLTRNTRKSVDVFASC